MKCRHWEWIKRLGYSQKVARAFDDKTICVWLVSPNGRLAALARTIRGQIEDSRDGQIFTGALSPPDGRGRQRGLSVGGYLTGPLRERNAIRLHDCVSGEVRALLHAHTDRITDLFWSASGDCLTTASFDDALGL